MSSSVDFFSFQSFDYVDLLLPWLGLFLAFPGSFEAVKNGIMCPDFIFRKLIIDREESYCILHVNSVSITLLKVFIKSKNFLLWT